MNACSRSRGVRLHGILVRNIDGLNQVPAFGASVMFDFGHLSPRCCARWLGR